MGRTSGEGATIAVLESIEAATEAEQTAGASRLTSVGTTNTLLTSVLAELVTLNAHIVSVKAGGASSLRCDEIP